MADVHDKATRSYNMSRIKSKDTKPEMLVRKFLHANGFRFRLHVKNLPGKPDIVLPKYKTVIFIHGCFWHGHNHCKYYVVPKTRTRDKEVLVVKREHTHHYIKLFQLEIIYVEISFRKENDTIWKIGGFDHPVLLQPYLDGIDIESLIKNK